MKRKDYLARFLHPSFRFWAGISFMIPYFMISSLPARSLLLVLFYGLALLSGKKIRILYFLFLTASITFFHLLTPSGRLLLEWGPLRISSIALESGIFKGLTLCGLVFLSLFSVSSRLQLPGYMGGLLGRMFYYFERILEGKKGITPKRFIESLDDVLMELFPPRALNEAFEIKEEQSSGLLVTSLLYFIVLNTILWGIVICLR